MANKGGFFILVDTITPNLASHSVEQTAEDELQVWADRILADAKQNAPWADRTGDARAGLDVDVSREGQDIVLELFHTVDYGLWLEVKNSGELAIIMPTLEKYAPDVFGAMNVTMTAEELT